MRKKEIPKVFFYSLTYEQTFINSSPKEIKLFLRELFELGIIESGNILYQIRSFKIRRIIEPQFVFDIENHIAIRVMQRKNAQVLFKEVFRNWHPREALSLSQNLKEWKREVWDFQVWRQVSQEIKVFALTTQSNIRKLPKIFELSEFFEVKRIMIWYSNNSFPIYLKSDKRREINHLFGQSGVMDLNLVWDNKHKRLIEKLNFGPAYVFGPITLQDNSIESKKAINSIVISYFDVTPMTINLNNIYTVKFALANLLAAIEMGNKIEQKIGMKVQLFLKPKRKTQKNVHSIEYIKTIRKFEQEGKLVILKPSTRLFKQISCSDLILGVPLTSPVQIGKYLGKQSAYLAVESEAWDLQSNYEEIPILRNSEDIEGFITQIINNLNQSDL